MSYDSGAFEAVKRGKEAWNRYRAAWQRLYDQKMKDNSGGYYAYDPVRHQNLNESFVSVGPPRKEISLKGACLSGLDLSGFDFRGVDLNFAEANGTNFDRVFFDLPPTLRFDPATPPSLKGAGLDSGLVLAVFNTVKSNNELLVILPLNFMEQYDRDNQTPNSALALKKLRAAMEEEERGFESWKDETYKPKIF